LLRLRAERLKRSMTMKKLSEKTGIPYTTLCALENGKAHSWPRYRRELAKALRVKGDLLFQEIGGDKPLPSGFLFFGAIL
jgi:transcriptional regulator with XRE-family HTH domain